VATEELLELRAPREESVALPRYFIPAMAGYMGMAAISIDILLPAFPALRKQFGLPPDSTKVSWLITAFFLGMAVGQLIYAPLSDGLGRKPPMAVGLVIFVIAGIGAMTATSLGAMVLWRFLWGVGAAGPRSLTMAMIRDTSEGDRMARMLSLIMAIFVLVPIAGPSLASLLLKVGSWRLVFAVPVGLAVVMFFVLARVPETLVPSRRRAVGPSALVEGARAVFRSRVTVGYGLAVVFLFGAMSSYIGGVEVIFDEVYHRAKLFPVLFGVIAVCFGTAAFLNARLVRRFGLRTVLRRGALLAVVNTALLCGIVAAFDGKPPLALFVASLALMLPAASMLVPNCNTAAMAPMPHIAGMTTALLGTTATAGGALLGAVSNRAFNGSASPFANYAFVYIICAAVCIMFVGRTAPPPVAGSAPLPLME
jgi:MFS transporter, DHA1 family, multidrug resistance protein